MSKNTIHFLLKILFLVTFLPTLSFAVESNNDELIQKGEYLTKAADCIACHTIKDHAAFSGGLAFKLPFGTIYSPNITPDIKTGIGSWTDEDFIRALEKGVSKNGKYYFPAFPYTSYAKMSTDDILAIKAYLFSLKPVRQKPKENDLSFPFNQRWGMFVWNLFFHSEKKFQPNKSKTTKWNRGAYLVQGPGHCGECHTPRNIFQATDKGSSLSGNVIAGWRAYNISSDKKYGIGIWPQEKLVEYLTIGSASGYGSAGGPMAEVVEHSLQYLTMYDAEAIAVYLKNSKPRPKGIIKLHAVKLKDSTKNKNNPLGVKIFMDACSSCHRLDGHGNQSPYASLNGIKSVSDRKAYNIINTLLTGHRTITGLEHQMPDFSQIYNNSELAAVTTFVLEHFGKKDVKITPSDIAKQKSIVLH